jgi:MFS family permease
MLHLLRQPNFRLLTLGGIVSSLGDWLLFIALPFYIYDLTGSALATGGMFIAETVPTILLGSVAGVFVDRWDRKKTMIVADVARGVLLLLLLTAGSRDWIWVIYVVTVIQSSIGLFFGPAKNALIPRLVDDNDLLAANSLVSTTSELTRLVGPALGGAVMALFGLTSVVVLDSASFLFSAAMVWLIDVSADPETSAEGAPDSAAAPMKVWQDFLAGLALVRRDRVISRVLLVFGLFMVGQGIINVLIVPFIKDVLQGNALLFGWVASAQGVGGLLGSIVIGMVGKRFPTERLFRLGLIALSVAFVLLVNVHLVPLVLTLTALAGVAVVAAFVGSQTLLQQRVTDQFRGRIFGVLGTSQSLLLLVGMGCASALGSFLGVVPMLDLASLLFLIAGAVAAAPIRSQEAPEGVPEPASPT